MALSPETVRKAQAGDTEARNEIVLDFLPRLQSLAKKLARYPRVLAEDLVQQGVLAVIHQLQYYEPARGDLTAYLHYRAWRWMLVYLNREMAFYTRWAPGNPDGYSAKVSDDSPRTILAALADEEREIANRYFGLDRPEETSKTIAADLGIGSAAVRMRIRKILGKLSAAASA